MILDTSIQGRVAIVTGAAGGLGRAFCLALAQKGAHVVVADLDYAGAEQTVEMLNESGNDGIAIAVDVSDETATLQMAAQAVERWGRIDILVNNAAIYAGLERKTFDAISIEEWDQGMAVNLKGPWVCTRAVFPLMKIQGKGKIINIASAVFYSGSPLWSHYVSSKGGLIGLTRSLAKELGNEKITVNAVAPGFTMTEASEQLIPDAVNYGVQRGSIKRSEQPEDLVGAVLFLASDSSDFITGQTIIIDGGRQFN